MVVSLTRFKAECLELFDWVAKTGQVVLVTKRGKPYVKVEPVRKRPGKSIFGCLEGTARTLGDIIAPIDVKWDAMQPRSRSAKRQGLP